MTKIRVLSIDDDPGICRSMRDLLERHAGERVEWLGEAHDVPQGVQLIHKTKPDLVLLDVDMPGYNGLELPSFFDKNAIDFHIVFCTAHDEYAINAFKLSALDYLLKPVAWEDLEQALFKVHNALEGSRAKERLLNLQENMRSERKVQKIALPVSDGFLFMPLDTICNIEASGSYSEIYDMKGTKLLVSRKIKEFEHQLEGDSRFLRIHRSHLINLDAVRKYLRQEGTSVLMENGRTVPVSREYRDRVMDLLAGR